MITNQTYESNFVQIYSFCETTSLPLCPDCSLVECVPKIEASDCPEGTHWEDNIIWGCCPACTRRIDVGKEYVFFNMLNHFCNRRIFSHIVSI